MKKSKLELESAQLIDSVPSCYFLLPSPFRLLPGELLSHHTQSTFPGHGCPLHHYRACRQVQQNQLWFPHSIYSVNIHFSSVSSCSLPSLRIPNCLIVSRRGRTQTQVRFLGCVLFSLYQCSCS